MTDNQYYAKLWLNRAYNISLKIDALRHKREKVQASMSGVAQYGDREFTSTSGNATETRMLEYSMLSQQIDEEEEKLAAEDIRTQEVINHLSGTEMMDKFNAVLRYRYASRLGWSEIADKIYYSESQTHEYHLQALEAVYPFIPKEEVHED